MNSSASLVWGAADSTRVQAILMNLFRVNLQPSHSSDCPPFWFVITPWLIYEMCAGNPTLPFIPESSCQSAQSLYRFNFWTCLKSEPLNRCKLIRHLGHSHILLDILGLDICVRHSEIRHSGTNPLRTAFLHFTGPMSTVPQPAVRMRLGDTQIHTQGTVIACLCETVCTNGVCSVCARSYCCHFWKYCTFYRSRSNSQFDMQHSARLVQLW